MNIINRKLDGLLTTDQFSYKTIRNMFLTLALDQFFIFFINVLSTAMVSSVGEAAIAAVSMVVSVNGIVSLVFTSLASGGAILGALKNLVTRGEGLDQMSGPVGGINIIARETQTYKLMGYLNMLIMISINLGLVNLLPIPGLDGCRMLFVLYEMIFRRPVNRKVEAYIHLAGYAFLMLVMIYFTFHDVLRIFG